jgi:hypothetical protein
MTALAGLLKPADRERLAARLRDLDELAALMRRPGLLSSPDEPPPLHRHGKTENSSTSFSENSSTSSVTTERTTS